MLIVEILSILSDTYNYTMVLILCVVEDVGFVAIYKLFSLSCRVILLLLTVYLPRAYILLKILMRN